MSKRSRENDEDETTERALIQMMYGDLPSKFGDEHPYSYMWEADDELGGAVAGPRRKIEKFELHRIKQIGDNIAEVLNFIHNIYVECRYESPRPEEDMADAGYVIDEIMKHEAVFGVYVCAPFFWLQGAVENILSTIDTMPEIKRIKGAKVDSIRKEVRNIRDALEVIRELLFEHEGKVRVKRRKQGLAKALQMKNDTQNE